MKYLEIFPMRFADILAIYMPRNPLKDLFIFTTFICPLATAFQGSFSMAKRRQKQPPKVK